MAKIGRDGRVEKSWLGKVSKPNVGMRFVRALDGTHFVGVSRTAAENTPLQTAGGSRVTLDDEPNAANPLISPSELSEKRLTPVKVHPSMAVKENKERGYLPGSIQLKVQVVLRLTLI